MGKYIIYILFLLFFLELSTVESVIPTVETTPVTHSSDAADDPTIWIHPTDINSSFFIGTDKDSNGRLELYDIDGYRFFYTPIGKKLNNVDLRYNFPFESGNIDIVCASNRTVDRIEIFRIDTVNRELINITGNTSLGFEPYGFTMYHDVNTNKFYGFVSKRASNCDVLQYELTYNNLTGENAAIDATLVRTLDLSSLCEGIVADDELGYVYIAEEDLGIWKYSAFPEDGNSRVSVDDVSSSYLTADLEGLTIYYSQNGSGYLLVSTQGRSEFAIYNRENNNDYVGNFRIISNSGAGIDAVSQTDGIEVLSFPIGAGFMYGAFIAHDGSNSGESNNSNFKIVPWENIAQAFTPNLTIDTSKNPRDYDNPLPVVLSSFYAEFINDTPLIYWITQSESNNALWNIYRADSNDLEHALKINQETITGAGTITEPTDYVFTDLELIEYIEENYVIAGTQFWYWLECVSYSGENYIYGSIILTIPDNYEEELPPEIPSQYGLFQNYPNPFNPDTEISFMMKENCIAELYIYNMKGEKVSTLFRNKSVAKDKLIRINWDGTKYGSGLYFYKLKTDTYSRINKMIMLK